MIPFRARARVNPRTGQRSLWARDPQAAAMRQQINDLGGSFGGNLPNSRRCATDALARIVLLTVLFGAEGVATCKASK